MWRLLQKVHISFPNIPVKTLFKLPANLADLGIALVIFYSLLKITDYRKALLSSLAYFFNPAPISNSTLWGQVDSVNVLPLLIAVSIGLRGYFTGAVVLAITGFMMKPLSIVIFPVIGFLICRDIYRRRKESNIALKTLLLGVKIIAASIITIDIFTLPYIWMSLVDLSLIFLRNLFTSLTSGSLMRTIHICLRQPTHLTFGA
jgi:Gpi18-like mannosyltransferase